MKPLYLSMKAFGPYADFQEVDFSAFHSGLYLITGDTGAGKTTIYDGLMFALFEETSNKPSGKDTEKGSVRDKSMVHSHFASKSIPTEVFLRFEEDDKTYEVKRICKYSKKRGGGNEYNGPTFEASLSCPPDLSVEGSSKVTDEVIRIIGMDATQFRQIVMLAQGEFSAFLEAKDNARKEILGKLFDSTPYVRFMNSLSLAKNELKGKADFQKQKRRSTMEYFPLPEIMTEEEKALYSPDHPQLLENIQALLAEERAQGTQIEEELKTKGEELQKLKDQRGVAKLKNDELKTLEELKKSVQNLEEQKLEMEEKSIRYEKAERAVHKVLPEEKRELSAQKTLSGISEEILKHEVHLTNAKKASDSAEEELKKNAERNEKAENLQSSSIAISKTLGDYDQRDEAEKNYRTALGKYKKANALLTESKQKKEAEEQARKTAEEELSGLESIETDILQLTHSEKEAEQTIEKLTSENGLTNDIKRYLKKKTGYTEFYRDWEVKKVASANKETLYRQAEEQYLRNQAGNLARELRDEIETKGDAVCPVCGSSVCRSNMPHFKVNEADLISDEDIKKLRRDSEKAKKELDEAINKLAVSATDLENGREAILLKADELLPEASPWNEERLTDGVTISALVREKEATLLSIRNSKKQAEQQKNRKAALQEENKGRDQLIEQLNSIISSASTEMTEAETNGKRYHETMDTLSAKLQYSSKKEAEDEIEKLNNQVKELKAAVESAENADKEAKERLNRIISAKELLMKQESDAKGTLKEAECAFATALGNGSFSSKEAYMEALPDTAEDGYEQWLTNLHKELISYAEKLDAQNKSLHQQAEKVKEYQYTNLVELDECIEEKTSQYKQKELQRNACASSIVTHAQAEKSIAGSIEEQKRIMGAFDRLSRLSDTANGFNGEGGKHAFDGYVLGKSFDEILQRATMHLDIMTGGRYTLVHEESGRSKASAADFVIQILDRYNGEQREIGSISGGEGFQVAMALALGLSDVAQAHTTGGKQIDAMFIDEGFGTLDSNALQNMLLALKNVSGGKRQIGMISHVDSLEEYISDKITVRKRKDDKGSEIIMN